MPQLQVDNDTRDEDYMIYVGVGTSKHKRVPSSQNVKSELLS